MAEKKRIFTWVVILERVYKGDIRTFSIPAPSGKKALHWARARLEEQGENARYWCMVGLSRGL
jgi:hypothetical protein